MLIRHMSITALMLGLFALVGTAFVAFTFDNTEERIAQNERETLLRTLNSMVPPGQYNNDLPNDTLEVTSELLGGDKPTTIYRARKDNKPIAAIITAVAPDGYNGAIKILVAIRNNGTIAGVRVLSHRETPGLGDRIDIRRSNWIESFKGYSLNKPGELGWQVKRDGGIFDQFTGATITPRAVVKAVYKSLQYYSKHKQSLFKKAIIEEQHTDGH